LGKKQGFDAKLLEFLLKNCPEQLKLWKLGIGVIEMAAFCNSKILPIYLLTFEKKRLEIIEKRITRFS